jgi:tetratricopeptide (TPR) repeat protein
MRRYLAAVVAGSVAIIISSCGDVTKQVDIQSTLNAAEQASQAGRVNECIARYTEVLGLSSDTVKAYVGRAGCYLKAGNAAAAVHDYSSAIRLSPSDPTLYIRRAEAEVDIGNQTAAAEDYKRLGQFSSASPAQLVGAADGLAQMESYTDALSLLDHGLKVYGNYWDLHRSRADVEVALGNDSEASHEFQIAATLARGAPLAQVFGDRGRYYLLRQQFRLAMTDYSNAIAIDPNNFRLFSGRAESRRQLGDFNGAEADFSSAIRDYQLVPQTDPDILADLFIERGKLYRQEGSKDKALADFKQALSISRASNALQRATIQKLIADVGG